MTRISASTDASAAGRIGSSPLLWVLAFVALVIALLSLPLRLPIGAHYWDLSIYLDGAHRLGLGQAPHRDFLAPVGGLSYLLYGWLAALFPQGHPLLVVQWLVLPLALPPLLVVVMRVARETPGQALALLAPFLLFAAFPMNGVELFPAPGFDGYGNYNRHVCLLFYALVAVLWRFDASTRAAGALQAALVAWLMFALVGIKITGFIIGAGFVAHAVLAGRLSWRGALSAGAIVLLVLAALDWRYGVVRAYLADLAVLIGHNTDSLSRRLLTVLSNEFDVLFACGALIALLAWTERGLLTAPGPAFASARFAALADGHAARVAVLTIGGAVFESQNTGSQEFIFLWPVLLVVMSQAWGAGGRTNLVVLALCVATLVPHAVKIMHRTARAAGSAPIYLPIPAAHLGGFGRLSAKREFLDRAEALLAHQALFPEAYRFFAERDQLPTVIHYSEIDQQIAWIISVDRAIAALKRHEVERGRPYASLYSADFVDLFAPALGRRPPLHIALGLDPGRTFPPPDAETVAALQDVEGILVPHCPVTTSRQVILERFRPALEGRVATPLTPCWTLMTRP